MEHLCIYTRRQPSTGFVQITTSSLRRSTHPLKVLSEWFKNGILPYARRLALDKSVFLSQDPQESLWQMHQQQEAQAAHLQRLQQAMEELSASGAGTTFGNTDDLPHPYGLCEDRECGACVAQAEEIAVAARETAYEDLKKALRAATPGDPTVFQRVMALAEVGIVKLQQEAEAATK